MELIELKNKIISSFTGRDEELKQILEIIDNDYSVFPFNECEYTYMKHYHEIRSNRS